MGDQRVCDRAAQLVFFTERGVNPSRAQAELAGPRPGGGYVLEIDVEFTELEIFVAGFTREQFQLTKKIDLFPNRGLDRDDRIVEPELRIGILPVFAAIKKGDPRF